MPPATSGLDVLDGIGALVDQSLSSRERAPTPSRASDAGDPARVRAGATRRGRRTPPIQQRHAADVLALAEEAEPHLFAAERGRWLRRLSEEQDNIRAALRLALEEDDPEIGLRLVGALWMWFLRRLLVEGRRWAEELLAHPGGRPTDGGTGERRSSPPGISPGCKGTFAPCVSGWKRASRSGATGRRCRPRPRPAVPRSGDRRRPGGGPASCRGGRRALSRRRATLGTGHGAHQPGPNRGDLGSRRCRRSPAGRGDGALPRDRGRLAAGPSTEQPRRHRVSTGPL